MKRLLTILLLSAFTTCAFAQVLKERRVYYLDCSYSMETNGLWDSVRDNLKKAIDDVVDETTELVVIPFAFNNDRHPVLKPMTQFATASGKAKLKSQIDRLTLNKNTMTYHDVPLDDFYKKRVDNNRVTYVFLMTDGEDQDPQKKALKVLLPQWGAKYGDRNVYGFYVMLNKTASDPAIDKVVNSQDHLWKVETANVNINLVRLQSNAIFNAKNDKYFDLPISGDVSGKNLTASFPSNCPYKVKKTENKLNTLRVWVDAPSIQNLPTSANYSLNMKMSKGGQFDFLVTDKVSVKCVCKPERSLKIHVR